MVCVIQLRVRWKLCLTYRILRYIRACSINDIAQCGDQDREGEHLPSPEYLVFNVSTRVHNHFNAHLLVDTEGERVVHLQA